MKTLQMKKINISVIMTVINMLLLLAGVIFVVYVTVMGYNTRVWYRIFVILMILGYSVMYNITLLYCLDAFDKMTQRQAKSYFLYMLFDLIALCFLSAFVVNAGDFEEPFHYIALGMFLLFTIPRHNLYHSAIDDIKGVEVRERKMSSNNQRRTGGYRTVTGFDVVRTEGRDSGVRTKAPVKSSVRSTGASGSVPSRKPATNYSAGMTGNSGRSGGGSAVRGGTMRSGSATKSGGATRTTGTGNRGREQFAEPRLHRDRFVNMELEGFVSGRSVDEKGNVSPK